LNGTDEELCSLANDADEKGSSANDAGQWFSCFDVLKPVQCIAFI